MKMSSPGLFGRDEEAATLRKCFGRMMDQKRASLEFISSEFSNTFTNSNIPKEVIFIKGQSGVGKSSLAASLKKDVSALEHGFFVEGKFDFVTSTEPYSGIATSFGKICRQLRSSPKEWAAAVCKMISCDFREEMQALLPLIPDLKEIVNSYASPTRALTTMETGGSRPVENGTEQVKYAFRLLVRALNAAFTPIVLVLDDLQWADLSSLHVIDYLVSDMQNANRLMIIGCYRSEEVLEKSNLSSFIGSLEEKKENFGFNTTEIALNSCQVDHVNKMIMSIMAIDDEKETEKLAEICYRRTLGNPFFVMQFMAMLENEALVSYDQSKWIWNVDEIERQTKHTMDVVSLLQARMRKLPEDAQLLLQYAACLGTSFSLSTIDIIWKEHGAEGAGNVSDLEKLLILVQGAGFLEREGENAFKWVHDKLQEAAVTLTNLVNASFKFKIGKTLVSALDEDQLEDELFDVVDLINRGNVTTRPELAALNLRAAKKARDLSAYQSAAKYVEFGAALLPRSHWTSHRALTLELYTVGAQMELALDNSRQAASYCNAVFNREDSTLMERLPLRLAVIAKLTGGDSTLKRKALDMCLQLLRLLGYNFLWPKMFVPVQTLVALIRTGKKTKRRLGQKGLSESLGVMTDPKHLAIMELFVRIQHLSYHLEEIFLTALTTCHMVKMTLKHGKCHTSGMGLTNIGAMSWIVLNEKFSTVVACVEQGLSLQEDLDPQYAGNTTAHFLCKGWIMPLEKCIQPFQQAYKSSMKVGNVEYGMWSMSAIHVWIPYILGSPIAKILKYAPHLVSHMDELHQMEQALLLRMYWQLFLNLQSASENGSKLTGMVFDDKRNPLTTGPMFGMFHLCEGELIFMYDLEMAADRAVQCGEKFLKMLPACFLGMMEMFHRGVALFAMARLRRKRKYRTRALKIRKTIKQWIQDGSQNVEHYDLFLDAEHASLTPRGHKEADAFYLKAIKSATQAGHLLHKALFNERYADFLLRLRGDKVRGSYRLSEAIAGYQQWGAVRKVDQLRQQLRKQQPQ